MMIVRNLAGHRRKKTFFIQQSTGGLWREIRRTCSEELLKTKQAAQAVWDTRVRLGTIQRVINLVSDNSTKFLSMSMYFPGESPPEHFPLV